MAKEIIYRLNDEISFRKCSLHDKSMLNRGDCTNYHVKEMSWKDYYYCNQDGIHLHCTKHPEIELNVENQNYKIELICPKCNKGIEIQSLESIYSSCQKLLNIEKFKGAKLIRLDDWYIPEIKERLKLDSEYWISTHVKTDKEGNTVVVLYIGHKGSDEKVQFFIKPENGQLSNDHKDLDPAKIISKIEVTLKNRILSHKYE